MTDVIEAMCGICGVPFKVPAYKVRQGRGRYCSRVCSGRSQADKLAEAGRRRREDYLARAHEIFWAKVDIRGPDECWPWKGNRRRHGYGRHRYQQRSWCASRLAYVFAMGTDPGSLLVCHRCDNPPCCNPKHLFLGTVLENKRDQINKGRIARPRAKLTAEQAQAIRAISGRSNKSLAREYGVNPTTIDRIKSGQTWQSSPEVK